MGTYNTSNYFKQHYKEGYLNIHILNVLGTTHLYKNKLLYNFTYLQKLSSFGGEKHVPPFLHGLGEHDRITPRTKIIMIEVENKFCLKQ